MNSKFILRTASATFLIVSLSYALTSPATAKYQAQTDLSQERVCHIETPRMAGRQCNDGEIMLYTPSPNSSASKISVILSSLVCDFRFQVMLSPEALSCVFTKRRAHQWKDFGMDVE